MRRKQVDLDLKPLPETPISHEEESSTRDKFFDDRFKLSINRDDLREFAHKSLDERKAIVASRIRWLKPDEVPEEGEFDRGISRMVDALVNQASEISEEVD